MPLHLLVPKVVLYFYPADGSPSCTRQAKAFKDAFGEFKRAGAAGLLSSTFADAAAHFQPSFAVFHSRKQQDPRNNTAVHVGVQLLV